MNKQLIVDLKSNKAKINDTKKSGELKTKNELNFRPSILSGYNIIGVNRIEVSADNVKSKAGGFFSHYLKCNGYDLLTIKEKSNIPVFIYIDKEFVDIYDATDIFFMNYKDTKEAIKGILGEEDIEVCAISLAGANKLDFAKIMFDKNKSCGKDGLGKLMGEKNIKAVVLKKQELLNVNDKGTLNRINENMNRRLNVADINSYFSHENNCYGCNVNCESTSIKKLVKKGIDEKRAKEIDSMCNEYGMDSVIFTRFLGNTDDIYKLAYRMMKNPLEYKVEHNFKTKKEEDIFDKLGFCRFLTNKEIIKKEELEELVKLIK
ncbi:aldehyde ferredoxin oxidoreductase N-terminal domain-containing protein [Terrisporobacter sp.]